MNRFDQNIVDGIKKAKWKLQDLHEKLEKGTHQCDCEFCDVEDESGLWPDEVAEVEKEIVELQAEVKRMERYAKDHHLIEERITA